MSSVQNRSTFCTQWQLLRESLQKYGPLAYAFAALLPIRKWTQESLVPLREAHAAIDLASIQDMIREDALGRALGDALGDASGEALGNKRHEAEQKEGVDDAGGIKRRKRTRRSSAGLEESQGARVAPQIEESRRETVCETVSLQSAVGPKRMRARGNSMDVAHSS